MDKKMRELINFFCKIFKSEASILIFYPKDINSPPVVSENLEIKNDYLLIQKKSELTYVTKFLYDIDIIFKNKEKIYNLTINVKDLYLNDFSEEGIINCHEKENYEKLNNIIDIQCFDLNNYYKLISETEFIQQLYNIIFKSDDYYYWRKQEFYGLILDQKEFCQKSSDFGSDNTQIYIYANSFFFGFKKDMIFSFRKEPGDYPSILLPRIEELGKELFRYYYNEKEFLLTNFDDMKFNEKSKIFWENRKHVVEDKKFLLPKEFLNNVFIISNQVTSFIYEKEKNRHF